MDEQPILGLTPDPGSYDHIDPERDRRVKAEAAMRERRLRDVEASILSTPTGREWLWRADEFACVRTEDRIVRFGLRKRVSGR
jgi:hypothetical protein